MQKLGHEYHNLGQSTTTWPLDSMASLDTIK